jgi:hypothetical protein
VYQASSIRDVIERIDEMRTPLRNRFELPSKYSQFYAQECAAEEVEGCGILSQTERFKTFFHLRTTVRKYMRNSVPVERGKKGVWH